MRQHTYTLSEAKAHLSELLDRMEAGENILITRYGKLAAQLVPPAPPQEKADWIGCMEGEIILPDGWEEWPEDIARDLGMIE